MRHKYWVSSNGTGTWNFMLMLSCVVHFKVYIYNGIPLIQMLILQKSWYFGNWGIVPKCGSPPERLPSMSLLWYAISWFLDCYCISFFSYEDSWPRVSWSFSITVDTEEIPLPPLPPKRKKNLMSVNQQQIYKSNTALIVCTAKV
jgi:hypothetical protein